MTNEDNAKNILGEPLQSCCLDPVTGFYRDGFCNTDEHDRGLHVVCAIMTEEFLTFSKLRGNDLTTPRPKYGFTGLKPGDGWCLCANRWKEAFQEHVAPPIKAAATHENALEVISLNDLLSHQLQ